MPFEGIYFEQIYIESGYFQTCGVRLPFVLSRDAHEILNRGDAEIKAFGLTMGSRELKRKILHRAIWAGRG
jgi:hypothetical protein